MITNFFSKKKNKYVSKNQKYESTNKITPVLCFQNLLSYVKSLQVYYFVVCTSNTYLREIRNSCSCDDVQL